jgi:hypothetical protein
MEKTKKVKRFTRVQGKPGSLLRKPDTQEKIKVPTTDQNTGAQQLYEGRKVRSSNQDNSTITEKEKAERKKQHAQEQKAEPLKNLTKANQ